MTRLLSLAAQWAGKLCMVIASGAALAAAGARPPPLIPIENFTAAASFSNPSLSPDGRAVAAGFNKDGKHLLVIHEVVEGGSNATRTYDLGDAEFNWARWPDDKHIVVSIRKLKTYLGDEIGYDRMLLVDRDGRSANPLGPEKASLSADEVIYWAPDGSYILLNVSRSIFDWPDVLRVDLPSGAMTRVQRHREGIFRWVADSKGIVVAGLGFSGWRFKVIYRPTPEDEWTTALRLRQEDDESESVYITKIDSNAQTGHVISRHGGDRWGLYEYDFKNKTFGTALFTNPQFDLWRFDYDHAGNLLWASYIDDRERVTWMDEADKALHADLSSAVPDKVAMVESSSRAKDVRIVHTSSSTDPGSYYYFTAASGKMIRLAMANEPLGRASLAPTNYTSYPARDGVNIPAYLTLPVGRDPVGLPLVVMPHGGPFIRDTGDFDFLVQYLANRGYAVLQPNFRGSLGYGQKFLELGRGQFGKAMQDDVDDGVKWLAASGKVDLRRVCIVGWSYGGYVAQVAAFRNPEMYQCAASVAGISDLKAMLRYERRFMFGDQYNTWRAQVAGDASTRELQAVSSLSQVGAIRIPLLIAHGTKDGNVPVSQSDKLAVALRAQGKPYEYLRIDGGDHSLSEEGQRTELLRWLDRFLGAHNPTDVLMATKPAPAAVTTPELP